MGNKSTNMKTLKFFITITVCVCFGILDASAQDLVLDSLFYKDGRIEAVNITKNNVNNIEFSFPNETLLNVVLKADLKLIKYKSGRVEEFISENEKLPIPEPEFIGEVYLIKDNDQYELLDKESGEVKSGVSFRANSFNALSLYVAGKSAKLRVSEGLCTFIIRCVDNQSDPMSIITLYKLTSSSKKRSVILSRDNSDNWLNSKTYSKNKQKFEAKKYGNSSYILTIELDEGEYGFKVNNPNNIDEKHPIISCIGVDEK